MKLKKLLSLVLAGVLAVSVAAVSGVSAQQSNPVELTVVTTNDIHGYHTYSQGSVVGLEYVAAIAQAEGADLVLDAGDTLHGQSFAHRHPRRIHGPAASSGRVRRHDHGQP